MYSYYVLELKIILCLISHQQGDRMAIVYSRQGPLSGGWNEARVTVSSLELFTILIVGRRGRESSGSLAVDDINLVTGVCPYSGEWSLSL